MLLAAALIAAAQFGGLALSLVVSGLLFMCPGLAVALALFPRGRFDGAALLAWTLVFGIGIAVLGGIFLDRVGVGLSPWSWIGLIATITALFGIWAMRRERPTLRASRLWIGESPLATVRRFGPEVAMFCVAILALSIALTIARLGAQQHPHLGYSQLWMVSSVSDGEEHVRLTVKNGEGTRLSYRLVLAAGGSVIAEWTSIALGANESWTGTVPVPTGPAELTGTLYRLDRPGEPYRRVWRDALVLGR
jgi:hypothetical protein